MSEMDKAEEKWAEKVLALGCLVLALVVMVPILLFVRSCSEKLAGNEVDRIFNEASREEKLSGALEWWVGDELGSGARLKEWRINDLGYVEARVSRYGRADRLYILRVERQGGDFVVTTGVDKGAWRD